MTVMLCDWILRMLSTKGLRKFCLFFVSAKLSARGDSIPTNIFFRARDLTIGVFGGLGVAMRFAPRSSSQSTLLQE